MPMGRMMGGPMGRAMGSVMTLPRGGSLNNWGNGSDQTLVTSGDVSFASITDGDMVVRQFRSLIINAGHTVTVANRCRGLLLYVDGDCMVNGTLTMTARGCSGDPTVAGGSDGQAVLAGGVQLWRRTGFGAASYVANGFSGCGNAALLAEMAQVNSTGSAMVISVARTGAAGGPGTSNAAGANGNDGVGNQTGGGASGSSEAGSPGTSGAGGAGTCFSGGAGSGGVDLYGVGSAGSSTGGAGGNAVTSGAGGTGNPGGAGAGGGAVGNSGTGGLLILLVKGQLTVGNTGIISADGVAAVGGVRGGGASGGGAVLILSPIALSNAGIIRAQGGVGLSSNTTNRGGNGTVQIYSVLA